MNAKAFKQQLSPRMSGRVLLDFNILSLEVKKVLKQTLKTRQQTRQSLNCKCKLPCVHVVALSSSPFHMQTLPTHTSCRSPVCLWVLL